MSRPDDTIAAPDADAQPAVDVLVDDSGRLGPLSYQIPAGTVVSRGDAVTVPFGRQQRHGLVLGPSKNPQKATREIVAVLGQRVDPADLDLAEDIAAFHFAAPEQIAARLSPRKERNSSPLDAGPVALTARTGDPALPAPRGAHRLLLRPPLASPARVAALEAERLASRGQVLILAPTVALLEAVLAEFTSGAARLDSRARAGAWNGWRTGSLTVGVGTRAAALYSASRLAGIVVVEEEHPGHLESSLPYTHSRDISVRRAGAHGAALALVSANPSAAGIGSGLKVAALPNAAKLWPAVRVVDRRSSPPGERDVTPALRLLLRQAAERGVEAVVLAETRPARRLCRRCRDPRPCTRCTDSGCRHPVDGPCPRCDALAADWAGWDAARLAATLPGVRPVTLSELTQLPPGRRLVVVFDADALLRAPALEPDHRSAATLLRCAEAAGAGGTVAVCTTEPDHPALMLLVNRDQTAFAKRVYEHARLAALPPFGHLVTVRSGRDRAPSTRGWPGQVHGPRRRDNEWEILVQVDQAQLAELRPILERLRARGKTRVWIA